MPGARNGGEKPAEEVDAPPADVKPIHKVDSLADLSPMPSLQKLNSFGLSPNPIKANASEAPPSLRGRSLGRIRAPPRLRRHLLEAGSDRDPSSVRPIKRSRRTSEGARGVDVNEFEGVDLAGISRKFPEEKRMQLAARIDASAEEVAGAWAALLLAQTGMRYAEWANTTQRVEQTKQNTLRIVKAVVDYLTTASQAKLRRTISYIVAKRRRQGFGHEEVITSMLLLRRSFEKGCGPINGEAGFLIDAVTRVMVGEVATYLHAINPLEESAPEVCLAEDDDDELGVERPEDVNLTAIDSHQTPHVVEDVRPPMHLFIVPKVPAQYVRAREGGAPIMLAPLWSPRRARTLGSVDVAPRHGAAQRRHRQQPIRHRGVHRVRVLRARVEGDRPAG